MIIYTVVTDENCPLPIQTIKSKHEHVCFHTFDIKEKQKFWNYEKIKIEESPLYTQRKYKLMSHLFIKEDCLYFDPKNLIVNIPEPTHDFMIMPHHFRTCMLDELIDWLLIPMINIKQAKQIINYFKIKNYDFLKKESCAGNAFYRKYTKKNVSHNKVWFKLWCKYKIRDQLWFYLSSHLTKLNPFFITEQFNQTPEHQPFYYSNPELHFYNLNRLPDLLTFIEKTLNIKYTINPESLKTRRLF